MTNLEIDTQIAALQAQKTKEKPEEIDINSITRENMNDPAKAKAVAAQILKALREQ